LLAAPPKRTLTGQLHARTSRTAWGHVGIVARADCLVALFLPAPRQLIADSLARHWPSAAPSRDILQSITEQIVAYFDGDLRSFRVELDLSAVPSFRRAVLEACRKIPYGKTASYSDLAHAVGNSAAVRAVGSAMANNPIPLIIPCHRVLRADGSLGGFSSPEGIHQKRRLLRHEGVELP